MYATCTCRAVFNPIRVFDLFFFSFISSTLDGSEVKGSSYKQGLKELMDICTLCNDSGLAYNEVHV